VLAEREAQIALKAKRAEEAAAEEARLIAMVEDRDAATAARERARLEAKAAAAAAYKADTEAAMRTRADARARVEEVKYEERLGMQQEGVRRARALAEAKERKLAELRASGVTDDALRAARLL